MRWPIYGLIACATLLLAASALGASRKDWTDCTQEVDPDRMIAGCTRVLNDRTVRNRAIAYVIRGLAWSAKNDFDHGPSGGRTDVVDGGSWSLAGGWSRPFEPGPLLWPLVCVGVANVPA